MKRQERVSETMTLSDRKTRILLRRVISLLVVFAVLLVTVAPHTMAQQPGCDWYWGYKWSSAGAWEYWCWDPNKGGWWYAANEDGTKQYYHYA